MGIRALIIAVIAALAALLPATPAHAGATGTITATDDVLYDDCHDVDYVYVLELPPGTTSWSMDIEVLAPDGTTHAKDSVAKNSDVTGGTGDFLLCSSDDPGLYTITASGETYGVNNDTPFTLPPETINIRKAHTRTRLTVSDTNPSRGQVLTLMIEVVDERPNGFWATKRAPVRLQRREKGGEWVALRRFDTRTDDNGRVVIRMRWDSREPVKFRAKAVREKNRASSVSTPVKVR